MNTSSESPHSSIPDFSLIDLEDVSGYLRGLQDRICDDLSRIDGKSFGEEDWERGSGDLQGGGKTRVLEDGNHIEKGGVNYSFVAGDALPRSATVARPELAGRSYKATGVSLVIHPRNPYVPTSHANVRFFVAEKPNEAPVWWFGGGYDLTPCYGFREDCEHWHRIAQRACQDFGDDLYLRLKHWCDQYFFIHHRDEARGVGGLFFDDFNELGFARSFAFLKSVGDSYMEAYRPIFERRKDLPYGERERRFQACRRGRYVEFNLVYDRGTIFGLQSGGRTESILMSLPPKVEWHYDWHPEPGSAEEQLYTDFLPRRDWIERQ